MFGVWSSFFSVISLLEVDTKAPVGYHLWLDNLAESTDCELLERCETIRIEKPG